MYTYDDLFDQRSVVGAKLEEQLKEMGVSKAKLCKETSVSRPTIDKLLSGTVNSKANFERHIRKILDYLQMTPDILMGNSVVQHNRLRAIRNVLRKKIEEIASETGYSIERLKAIESGENASLVELRDIALALHTGTRCLLGDGFFETQFSTMNDFLFEDEEITEGCGFWGHIGILPAGTDKHLWFPITGNVRQQVYRQIQNMKRIVVPCMNNKVLLLNLNNIKQLLLLDDACDQPDFTNWDSSVNCGGVPLVLYEALKDYIAYEEWGEPGKQETMSAKFYEVMQYAAEKEGWNEDSLYELQRVITHYRDGKIMRTSMDFQMDSSLISEIDTLYGFEDDRFVEDYLDYIELGGTEIIINMNEIAMIELPLIDVEEAICDSVENDI